MAWRDDGVIVALESWIDLTHREGEGRDGGIMQELAGTLSF